MAKAAIKMHAPAMYSLAVIELNGSGGPKNAKNLTGGVGLFARAAYLGHVDALIELGRCLQHGYGVRQNVVEGRRLLVQASTGEVASFLGARSTSPDPSLSGTGCGLFGLHPVNTFLKEWFGSGCVGSGLRMCSHVGCGRPETRPHEFRRCSVCGAVNYCSRACQAMDWMLRHKIECVPMEPWLEE